MKKTGVLLPTRSSLPSVVQNFTENPRTSRHVSGEPCSPATLEKRCSVSVVAPGWNTAARVYAETSSVTVNVPKAPPPLAWTIRSGMRSRLNWASFSTR